MRTCSKAFGTTLKGCNSYGEKTESKPRRSQRQANLPRPAHARTGAVGGVAREAVRREEAGGGGGEGEEAEGESVIELRKVYLIAHHGGHVHALLDIEIAEFHGVPCIKGTQTGAGVMDGTAVFIPLAQINGVTEFESQQAHAEAMRVHATASRNRITRRWVLWTSVAIAYAAFIYFASHYGK